MPDVRFRILAADALDHSASPVLALSVEASVHGGGRIDSILLRIQARIEASRRAHSAAERGNVQEVFGDGDVWSRSSKSLLWTQGTAVVPAFESATTFEFHLPCGYDFATAAAKYLHGLEGGDIPISLAFSGTVFERTPNGLGAAPLPWDREAAFAVPVGLIRRVVDLHFPESNVVPLHRDVFEHLNRYRREQGLSTWTDAVRRLLSASTEGRA